MDDLDHSDSWSNLPIIPDPPAAPQPPPTELIDGRYRVERVLGQGAMGVVFEATDTGLGRRVALKVIARESAEDPLFVERFVREAKALAAIRHQNIVQVHALGQHRGAWYYAMEFVDGRSLDRVIAEHAERGAYLPVREALSVIRQIAAGLSAVHAARIIHRDVKPANVMLERETGRPVLIDFGIARPAFNRAARATLMVGSPTYMAPEQIQPRAGQELSPATDLYALGCVAYELLASRAPFDSTDVYQVLRDQIARPPAPLSSHRPELACFDALLARLLAKRPEDRVASCLALVRELDRLALEWDAGRASGAPLGSTPDARRARVVLASGDAAFLARARRACHIALRDGWDELAAGEQPDLGAALAPGPAPLVLLHCDGLPDAGVSLMARLREGCGPARPRVVAFGAAVDPLQRWRLGSLGVSELQPPSLDFEALAEVVQAAAAYEPPSGLPGARPSTVVRPADGARVPVELFLQVLACGWSEGALPTRAGPAVLDAAEAEGHGPAELDALRRACREPVELVDVDASALPPEARVYAYAFATWIALADDVISPREESSLHVLAFALGLPVGERTAVQSAVEQLRERASPRSRDGFRFDDFRRAVAPAVERALRAQRAGTRLSLPR